LALLAIETSTRVCGVAIVESSGNRKVLFEKDELADRAHSRVLLPMIDEALLTTGLTGRELDAIAVSVGPGSFTGLRIGLATAKGLAMAWELPVVMVGSLEVIAMRVEPPALACPIEDARRGMYYSGLYAPGHAGELCTIVPAGAYTMDEIGEFIGGRDNVFMLGESGDARFLDDGWLPRARDLGALATVRFLAGQTVTADEVVPVYLRRSDAEEKFDPQGPGR
jgi:tRNA threonylcarbamoyladenosine biosynthesis protein TsaB